MAEIFARLTKPCRKRWRSIKLEAKRSPATIKADRVAQPDRRPDVGRSRPSQSHHLSSGLLRGLGETSAPISARQYGAGREEEILEKKRKERARCEVARNAARTVGSGGRLEENRSKEREKRGPVRTSAEKEERWRGWPGETLSFRRASHRSVGAGS